MVAMSFLFAAPAFCADSSTPANRAADPIPAAVPEPSGLASSLIGFLAIGLLARSYRPRCTPVI